MNRLTEFIDALNECENTNSRKEKETILLAIKDNEFLRVTSEIVFNPFITLGISAPVIEPDSVFSPFSTEDELWGSFVSLTDKLRTRDLTGNMALRAIAAFQTSIADNNIRAWFNKFLNKEFVSGVGKTTIAKVYPSLKSSWGVQLASPRKSWEFLDNGSTWVAEPKMDGFRCVIFSQTPGIYVALSRQLKEFYFGNVQHIIEQLKPFLDTGIVFDGELLATNWNDTSSIASSKFDHPDRLSLNFHVFDCLSIDELLAAKSERSQRERSKQISLLFQGKSFDNVIRVEQKIIRTKEEAISATREFVKQGFEGSVFKDLSSQYENIRSEFWVKDKPVQTEDLPIIAVKDGDKKFSKPPSAKLIQKCSEEFGVPVSELQKLTCSLGSVELQSPSGETSFVGSGFSETQRVYYMYLHKGNKLIGQIVEAEFQEITKDGALRFGVFLRLRTDK